MSLPFPKFDPDEKSQEKVSTPANSANSANQRSKTGNCTATISRLAELAALPSDFKIVVDAPWDFENPPWWELLDVPAGANLAVWVEHEERAAILEFEAGLTRQEAERRALIELETIQKGN